MQPVSKIGDRTIGVCQVHGPKGGTIIEGHANTLVNGIPDSTVTHTVLADCGHTGKIITGNFTALDHNLATARIGDMFAGIYSGTIITGSSNTIA